MKQTKKNDEEVLPNPNKLHSLIKQAYVTLEQKYSDSNNAKQVELLKNYITVLDRVSDQLIYAQEKFFSVDTERMKDDKCVNYATEISKYRKQCFELKSQIKKASFKLHLEESKGDKLRHQNEDLRELCGRKAKSISHFRTFMPDPKTCRPRNSQLQEKSAKKIENPETERPSAKTQLLKLNLKEKMESIGKQIIEPSQFNLDIKANSSRGMATTRPFTLRERFNPKKLSAILGQI